MTSGATPLTSFLRAGLVRLLLVTGSILVSLLSCELGLRIYQRLALDAPMGNDGLWVSADQQAALPNLFDHRLGWRPTEGYALDSSGEREDGSRYPLHVTQGRHGFRRFGSGSGPRTFVVGDSYTQALEVSDDRTYYARLEREVGLRMYAIGSSGYGTLQESMLLDQHFDEVKPELVIWQFCYNDFMNNSYELESAWTAGNSYLHDRPYLDGGEIRFRPPGSFARLRRWAWHSTRLYGFVAGRLARAAAPSEDLLLKDILAQGAEHPGFRDAVEITDRLFARIAARVGGTPVMVFETCTTAAPFYPAIKDIARRHGMQFAPELPGALDVAEQRGSKLLAADHVHWNEEGHRIIADTLTGHVRRALAGR